jgi:hypothetical protein
MWQNLGTDASPSWVALVKSGDLANYATIAAVNFKANIASPALTGNPTAPTQTAGNDSTRIATTAFVAASFATTSAVAAGYQPLDSDLTAIAALTTTSTGRSLLTESTAQTGTGALVRAASPTFTGTLNAAAIMASGTVVLGSTFTGFGQLKIQDNNNAGGISIRGSTNPGVSIYSGDGTLRGFFPALVTTNNSYFSGSLSNDVVVRADTSGAKILFGVGPTSTVAVGNNQVDVTGNLTASGTLRVGGGTVVANILSATATLDFPSIGSNGTETLTITVTGAVAGDSVFLGCPAGLDAGLIFCASVTAADTVTVRMHNSSGGSIDPASATFRATVIRF